MSRAKINNTASGGLVCSSTYVIIINCAEKTENRKVTVLLPHETVFSKYINQMSHDMDYPYWTGNTAPGPYAILAREANAFSGSFLLSPKSCVQSPVFHQKSNKLHQLNRLSASRTVPFLLTASNCSLRVPPSGADDFSCHLKRPG